MTYIGEAVHGVLGGVLGEPPNVDLGLVQTDSPFLGTARFGLCFVDTETSEMSATGCVMSVRQFDAGKDGRTLVLCRGECRMLVEQVHAERPVLVCRARLFDEGPMSPLASVADVERHMERRGSNAGTGAAATAAASAVAAEVRELYRDVVALGATPPSSAAVSSVAAAAAAAGFGDGGGGSDGEVPLVLGGPELDRLTPAALAYFVASRFDAPDERLAALEAPDAPERLARVRDVLGGVAGYLRAEKVTQIKWAMMYGHGGDHLFPTPTPVAMG